jgi:hypothetical protein
MRLLLAILCLMSFLSLKAQVLPPGSQLNYSPGSFIPDHNQMIDSSHSDHKWIFSKYVGLSAGFSSFAGGTSFISAPLRLQLSRPLNKNIYAFTAVSVSPVFFNMNHFATGPGLYSSYPGLNHSNGYGLGVNPSVYAGLMYINDAKTFSISGSVGLERDSYPVYPSHRMNTIKQ